MVDFKKHVRKKRDIDITNLITVFESLDRRTSHIELRPAQQEALRLLSNRRADRDIILKISTGIGKTAVGLLYLWSFMEETQEPVVYLCPTKQLCEQVYTESEKLGVKSVIYPGGKTFPHVDGISAKAIIICTYDKLFNAKTTFDRNEVMLRPCAVVLDDAHAGVEEIRDCFTLNISESNLRKQILKILNEPCSQFKPAVWADVTNENPNQSMEIPYWIWKPLLPEIEKVISVHSDDEKLQFIVPHVRDLLRWCRCVVSGAGIEIIPDILPIHKSKAFHQAPHRLFMSATLADDSILVRELGCDISAAEKPVIPNNDRGLGERMVLAPSLIDSSLNREWVMSICTKLSKKLNVVVLSPSEQKAREWESAGANVYIRDQVNKAVTHLKDNPVQPLFAVFVQRYDGIDLPDDSCRVLVLDGMPFGEGILDRYDSSLSGIAGGTRNRLVYRIEQGMGRAVRSHADYAVILLVGDELAHFIARHDVLSAMNPDTQAQLRLAIDLAKLAMEDDDADPEKATVDMIRKCLKRDGGWKQFYNETIRNVSKQTSGITEQSRLNMACAERMAFESTLANDPNKAATILRSEMNQHIKDNPGMKGWYLQRIANYLYDVDPGEALEVQRSAYENNKLMICPPGVVKRPKTTKRFGVQAAILNWYKQFENPNGAIASINELKTQLSFDMNPANIEQGLCDLAPLLGAEGTRPEQEYGQGPDDLWLWPDVSLVIEAKNQNEDSLHKRDAGQLLQSLEWFGGNYPARNEPIPVVLAKALVCDRDARFPNSTRIITPRHMRTLLNTIEQFFRKMISEPLLYSTPQAVLELQQSFNLTPEQFVGEYTDSIKKAKPK
ncbi:MAG TPA: DEAD/DEAH box helicase [Sedimentisphaerales bacterium]|nr:DEAD/DEAH box helicase [Sedimentisphaerales bacterium]